MYVPAPGPCPFPVVPPAYPFPVVFMLPPASIVRLLHVMFRVYVCSLLFFVCVSVALSCIVVVLVPIIGVFRCVVPVSMFSFSVMFIGFLVISVPSIVAFVMFAQLNVWFSVMFVITVFPSWLFIIIPQYSSVSDFRCVVPAPPYSFPVPPFACMFPLKLLLL